MTVHQSGFSRNQWRSGGVYGSRCIDCVSQGEPGQNGGHTNNYANSFRCDECQRSFSSHNQLKYHRQVHLERNVACPICREVRFKSATNAVQHVEAGACRGCQGYDNARRAIYNFAKARTPNLLNQKALTYGGGYSDNTVPDEPYCCPHCDRTFRNASSLMQHGSAKHRTNHQMIAY